MGRESSGTGQTRDRGYRFGGRLDFPAGVESHAAESKRVRSIHRGDATTGERIASSREPRRRGLIVLRPAHDVRGANLVNRAVISRIVALVGQVFIGGKLVTKRPMNSGQRCESGLLSADLQPAMVWNVLCRSA
jgi:hypothetical protein